MKSTRRETRTVDKKTFKLPSVLAPKDRQAGFTLIEVGIALVIIGLLLGAILKGWELIVSARIRQLADTTQSVQAAYFAFMDRYGHVAGDWSAAAASVAIGASITGAVTEMGGWITPPAQTFTMRRTRFGNISPRRISSGVATLAHLAQSRMRRTPWRRPMHTTK